MPFTNFMLQPIRKPAVGQLLHRTADHGAVARPDAALDISLLFPLQLRLQRSGNRPPFGIHQLQRLPVQQGTAIHLNRQGAPVIHRIVQLRRRGNQPQRIQEIIIQNFIFHSSSSKLDGFLPPVPVYYTTSKTEKCKTASIPAGNFPIIFFRDWRKHGIGTILYFGLPYYLAFGMSGNSITKNRRGRHEK